MAAWTAREMEQMFGGRVMLFDGAMGTSIQALDLAPEDFGGPELDGCNEHLNLTRPQVIEEIHRSFLAAGADIIETNSFGATSVVLSEYALQDMAMEINRAAAQIARRAADAFSDSKPRLVAGSMGPGTKSISLTGGIDWDEVEAAYREQALGLLDGGVDLLLLETVQDALNLKAAAVGCLKAAAEAGVQAPLMISGTIEMMGTALAGQTIEALVAAVEHLDAFSVGLNCATGPAFMTDRLRAAAQLAKTRVTVAPNAGLPDENGNYLETPESMTQTLERFVDNGWVNALGGCCGTTPEHIASFAQMIDGKTPRAPQNYVKTHVSGLEYLEIEEDGKPYLVGERTNVLGSRRFKKLIADRNYEAAAEIGRKQARGGANILDICLQDPDRDEQEDMRGFLTALSKIVKLPLMIDSTDPEVIEAALKMCQGKSIVNSINLEDGEERFARVVPLGKRYGAAFIVGTIDEDPEQGMGVTVERKLEIARRSHGLLTGKYGVPEEDIIWDPLVFPIGAGDENYAHAGKYTIEAVGRIKAEFPNTKTALGISNVSFGLPTAGREALNAVFMYHCAQAGLDLAIVNTERLERYASIPERERELSERLIFDNSAAAIAEFTDFYRERKTKPLADEWENLSLDERLARRIVEGVKEGMQADLDIALEARKPLEIVNGPLMDGMDEVGRLFNNNELIVAEVLQSAEAMKAAVSHLEPHMEASSAAARGSAVLATVKGDVHDIGKNLVDIILTNNGYKVHNLGIKVPPETIIQACRQENPDIIGLSGLLVKSAHQMVAAAEDLANAGVSVPMLVGGAALSKRFTETRIDPAYTTGRALYAKDAMEGLALANALMDEEKRGPLLRRTAAKPERKPTREKPKTADAPKPPKPLRSVTPPNPPNLMPHIVEEDLDALYDWINPQLLYGRALGFRGNFERRLEEGDPKALELRSLVRKTIDLAASGNWIRPRAVYQFFWCASEGDAIVTFDSSRETVLERFEFPRQPDQDRRCLSDYVQPVGGSANENWCLFVTTAGEGVLQRAAQLKEEGEYLISHALGALAYEAAEAFAEKLHSRIRAMWGFPDPPDMPMKRIMQGRYRGQRYSFGYPACPDMADQAKLWRLLKPERIGVQLTETHMMDPEASVSALALHHPDARYFDARSPDAG